MKKLWYTVLIFICLLAIAAADCEWATIEGVPFENGDFHVTSLRVENACTDVYIDQTTQNKLVSHIFTGALDGIPQVERIHVPSTVSYIDDDVFVNHPQTALVVFRDSYAHQYARQKGLRHYFRGTDTEAEYVSDYLGNWEVISCKVSDIDSWPEDPNELIDKVLQVSVNATYRAIFIGTDETSAWGWWWWTEHGVYISDGTYVAFLTRTTDKMTIYAKEEVIELVRVHAANQNQ